MEKSKQLKLEVLPFCKEGSEADLKSFWICITEEGYEKY